MNFRSVVPASNPARRSLRKARDRILYAVNRARHGAPDQVVSYGHGGIGDSLLCSAVCRELQLRAPRRLWLLSPYPALFECNSDVAAVLPFNDEMVALLRRRGHPVIFPHYNTNHWLEGRDDPPREHIIAAMCRSSGISNGTVSLRPYLSLSTAERSAGRLAHRQIAIQSSGLSARFHMRTKEWFPDRFAEVARSLPNAEIIQLGGPGEPLLPGVRDLRGRTSLREAAAILDASELFIGLVGLLMHLSRAVDCPSVIVYGGRELPGQTGYSANLNVARSPDCSPCWLWHDCDYAMKCMDEIPASEVIGAVRQRLEQPRGPLAVGIADLAVQPSPQCGSP